MKAILRRLLLALLVTASALFEPGLIAADPAPGEVRMRHVGRSFVFDYGEMVIRVRYLSDSRLEWEQTKGPQAGLKAEEQYGSAAVRDDVVFFWWQEKDQSVVSQVVDFGKGVVYTTWTSPDRKLAQFQGKVRPQQ
ncbi:MAG TPA: MoaF N-terminal domain-containing protein [Candidatus Polarisedimenticolia bacterium]|nr:MoaF N-terminal domain-containing protein [Candidatus Polarisedimenticolia bacterium]